MLVNDKVHRWSRGTVVRLSQIGMDDVTSCPAHQLTSATVFLLDHGVTRTISQDMCVHARTHLHRHCYGYGLQEGFLLGLSTAFMFALVFQHALDKILAYIHVWHLHTNLYNPALEAAHCLASFYSLSLFRNITVPPVLFLLTHFIPFLLV